MVEQSSEKAAICSSSIFTLSRSSAMLPLKRINIFQGRVQDRRQSTSWSIFAKKLHEMRIFWARRGGKLCHPLAHFNPLMIISIPFLWSFVRVTLVGDWRFLSRNFRQVVGTYEGLLPFCECTWGGGSTFRWSRPDCAGHKGARPYTLTALGVRPCTLTALGVRPCTLTTLGMRPCTLDMRVWGLAPWLPWAWGLAPWVWGSKALHPDCPGCKALCPDCKGRRVQGQEGARAGGHKGWRAQEREGTKGGGHKGLCPCTHLPVFPCALLPLCPPAFAPFCPPARVPSSPCTLLPSCPGTSPCTLVPSRPCALLPLRPPALAPFCPCAQRGTSWNFHCLIFLKGSSHSNWKSVC